MNFERPEQKFGSLDELKEHIRQDKEYAAAYFERNSTWLAAE